MHLREAVGIYARGVAMGAADSVPGVSGGTIALITGIYDRLVSALAGVRPRTLRRLLGPGVDTHHRRAAAVRLDVGFLLVLGIGILTAFVVAAETLTRATSVYPGLTYAFFLGLIAASAVVFGRQVHWTGWRLGGAGGAAVLVGLLSGMTATAGLHATWLTFLSGVIAISAMVLPGLSGALLLVILGQYEFLLAALRATLAGLRAGELDPAATTVVVFLTGAVVGLLTTAQAVSAALARARETTLAVLLGLLVGGCVQPLLRVTAADSSVVGIVLATGIGAGTIVAIDRAAGGLAYT